jgi:acyl-[acyl carrier protein]--UDP-N-acetylglucosamine O-acyltransferase
MKYELTGESRYVTPDGKASRVFQIRAVRDIPEHGVKAGDTGGWLWGDRALSHNGSCWVAAGATVSQGAAVLEHAYVGDTATLQGFACAHGRARIEGRAVVGGHVHVKDDAQVNGTAMLMGMACAVGREVYSSGYEDTDTHQD